jgi:hypothetical protein
MVAREEMDVRLATRYKVTLVCRTVAQLVVDGPLIMAVRRITRFKAASVCRIGEFFRIDRR